ncbi:phosphatase PAP2 family protein [Enterococcus asini]|uniref:phosphatase PAP2 family protein n=1 Tax=Enterococcus TaxID=1350 RepID=UPI00288F04AC|nr:phosphatase PAP2 family protein [Enterococcus asini]MDT2755778.1 phosphatase PAP2 family protein [Enterococcus asini]
MKNKLYYQFAGSCFLLVFVFLAYVVKFYPKWLQGFDSSITKLVRMPYPNWHPFYLTVTKLGDPPLIISLAIFILAILLLTKHYAEGIWLALGFIGIAGIVNPLIKLAIYRQRPTLEHLVTETSYSFPSGHSATSMVLFGTLIFCLVGLVKIKPLRFALQIILGLVIFTIGISRIYLGVHFPTDILAGFCLSLGWLCLTYPIFDKQRFIWRFQGKQR